jgi:hypothetical protein
MLGTFASVLPSPAAIDSLQHLLAWKLALHGVPALGNVSVVVAPEGAVYTPFRPGARVVLPRVAGHRDGCTTDCPGNALYYRLPAIRPRIAQLEGAPTILTLTTPRQTVAPGTQVTIGGRLAVLDGEPIGGAPIELQQLSDDQASTLATVTTAADGSWSVTMTVQRDMVLRALHPVAPAAASRALTIGVRPILTLTLVAQSPVRVSGTISPARQRVTLDIYRLVHGRRRLFASKKVRAFGGRFSAPVLMTARPGTYVVVARVPAGGGTLAGASAPLLHIAV